MRGGDKADRYLSQIAERVGGKYTVKVGFLPDATYPDGTKVASVAFWLEFGTRFMPARPFFRNMIDEQSPEWGAQYASILKSVNFDVPRAMAFMGELIKDQLVQSINDFTSPPLADSTIARKGFDKPLIHTGQLVRSPAYEVVKA